MSDLEQLKELLFGPEKQALDSIAARVEQRDVRAADVADVLPDAVYQSHKKGGELVESLSEPVGQCLQRAFREDPETYGDALYPVMGPAIRKSIMHALRNFAQQINTAVEHSISPRGLKWRWQASRAGIPFGEFLLQRTLQFRVEQAYLISRENGLLIGHVHHESAKIKDSDAVSAMFTAIQDFVKESFSPDRTGRLESADMGEFTLWAVHGPHALLVCVIRGVPPKSLRSELSAILERLHFRYGDAIRDYRGDTSTVGDVEGDLARCLRYEAHQEPEQKRGGARWWWLAAALVAVAIIAWSGFREWQDSRQLMHLRDALEGTPGLHVTQISREDDGIIVRGLRDPLAEPVAEVASAAGIPESSLRVSMRPYQSLDPAIIEARASQLFGSTADVQFRFSGGTLKVTGDASPAWQREMAARYGQLGGVTALDMSDVTDQSTVSLLQRAAALSGASFVFVNGTELAPGQGQALASFAKDVGDLAMASEAAGLAIELTVTGATDALGSVAANQQLAQRRAEVVAAVLAGAGLNPVIGTPDIALTGAASSANESRRRARVTVTLGEASAPP